LTDRPRRLPLTRVVSGGQTGVDRAALDVALAVGLPVGGWCPRGRVAEDGRIPETYPLRETATADHAERTALNVRDSDATLILHQGPLTGGTAYTADVAAQLGRPLLAVDLRDEPDAGAVQAWLRAHAVQALNVAGPRESTAPGIYEAAFTFLAEVLA